MHAERHVLGAQHGGTHSTDLRGELRRQPQTQQLLPPAAGLPGSSHAGRLLRVTGADFLPRGNSKPHKQGPEFEWMVSDLKVVLDINNVSKSNEREWEWIST